MKKIMHVPEFRRTILFAILSHLKYSPEMRKKAAVESSYGHEE
ncbi:MAG TPA: hypothetical protein VLG49_02395 [Rhabdochlamydiaceae bacterium]|nr:hypothetical protein [Rhabdochlamydiaceae bacterium]